MTLISLAGLLMKGIPDAFAAGVVKTVVDIDDFIALVPFMPLSSDTFKYTRQKALPSFGWLGAGATITPDATAANAEVTAYLRTVGGDLEFSNLQGARGGGTGSVIGKLMEGASQAIGRTISSALINGSSTFTGTVDAGALEIAATVATAAPGPNHDLRNPVGLLRYTHGTTSWAYRAPGDLAFGPEVVIAPNATGTLYSDNPDLRITVTRGAAVMTTTATASVTLSGGTAEFDGILALKTASQEISGGTAVNGENLSFGVLDKLIQGCKGAGQKYVLMPSRTYPTFQALSRTMGGITMAEIFGRQVPTYNGAVLLRSDFMPVTQSKGASGAICTTLFCMTLGENQGFHGLMSNGVPGDVPPPNARMLAQVMPGIQIWDLGIGSTADTRKLRATAYVSAAAPMIPALSWADGIKD